MVSMVLVVSMVSLLGLLALLAGLAALLATFASVIFLRFLYVLGLIFLIFSLGSFLGRPRLRFSFLLSMTKSRCRENCSLSRPRKARACALWRACLAISDMVMFLLSMVLSCVHSTSSFFFSVPVPCDSACDFAFKRVAATSAASSLCSPSLLSMSSKNGRWKFVGSVAKAICVSGSCLCWASPGTRRQFL